MYKTITQEMIDQPKGLNKQMTRREMLKTSLKMGTYAVGASFIASPNISWAIKVNSLKPDTMATLVQMAKDIYPHNHVPTKYYVESVKGYDNDANKEMIETGVSLLNQVSGGSYLDLGWETDRVAVLEKIENTDFFQTIRGNLVTGLYNQKEVWPLFGYEGESFSKGGYINRGFDDIEWLN